MEYNILSASSTGELEVRVEEHMRKGFYPLGGVATCVETIKHMNNSYLTRYYYFQAMTK